MSWCRACCESPPNEARRTGAGGPGLAGLQALPDSQAFNFTQVQTGQE